MVHQQQPPAPPQQQQQPGSPTMMASVANPFAAPPPPPVAANNNTANPFAVPPQMAQPVGTSYPQQPHQQQLVPLPPNAVVQSPWALQPVGGSAMVVSFDWISYISYVLTKMRWGGSRPLQFALVLDIMKTDNE